MKTSSAHYLLGIALLAIVPCSAQVLINDNFESYAAGQSPGSPWTVGQVTSPSSILVSTAAQSPFGTSGGTQGVVWYDGDTSVYGPNLSTTFTVPASATSLLWSFDFMAPNDGIAANPVFVLADAGGKIGPRLFLDRNSSILGASNGAATVTVASTVPDTWYHVDVSVSLADRTYIVSVVPYGGSTITSTALAFNNAATGALQQLRLADNDQSAINGTLYLDNITLSAIPEPHSAAMLAASSALACVFVRRRRLA